MKFSNKLCILFLSTEKEYDSGVLDDCISRYFLKQVSVDKKFDIYIYLNKGYINKYKPLLEYEKLENVNNVFVFVLNLTESEDFYARTPEDFSKVESTERFKLGGSTGPNNLFYRSFENILKLNYRDILMLETDSQPIKNYWLDKIVNYCDNNVFLIAGSTYKGKEKLPLYESWTGHLNGIAIYRNIPFLKLFIEESKKLIEYNIKNNINNFISFDVAMHFLYCGSFGRKNCHSQSSLHKNLIDSSIIANFSLPIDAGTPIDSVIEQYPETIILHKKRSLNEAQTLLPVYYHIAKNAGTYVLSATSFLLDQHLKSKSPQEECGKIQASINFPSGNKCTVFLGGPGLHDYFALHYHAKIASTPYHKLDIGGTYPNDSNWTNLEYAQKLRENAVTALHKKFPQAKTYQDYQVLYEETIPLKIKKTSEFSPEEFLSFIQNNKTFIFAVLIEPRNSGSSFVKSELIGWEDNLEFINEICERHNRQPINFLTLREPFSRANSLFYYLTSSDSDHELVRDEIASSTFEQYIESEELEDSWLIRQVLCLKWSDPIDEGHYNIAIEKLKEFYIKDITQVDYLIEEIFSKSYNLSFSKAPESYLNRNKSSKINTLQFNQLPPRLQQKFLDRTRWDKKLYNRLTQ